MTTDISTIQAALAHIPSGDRDLWVRMAMAVKSECGEDGFDTWDQWSQADETYNAADAKATWKSCKANGRITIGTLFHEAKQHGFKLDGTSKPKPPTTEEIEARRQVAAEAAARQEADYVKAADRARAIYQGTTKAADDHGYLVKKGIRAHGARLDRDGRLVLPVFDSSGEIQSLQFIDANGGKQFLPGGRMAAGRLPMGKLTDGSLIIIAEGFATAISIREACQATVVVAFSGSNMAKVAADLRRHFPKSPILIAGDLNENPKSAEYAHAAAEAAKPAKIVFPTFKNGRADGDFNDLAQAEGTETVARQINTGLHPGQSSFPFVAVRELMAGPRESHWLVRDWIESGSLALLFGESTAGKSFLALDWAACIATGTPWNDLAVTPGPVFYIAGEGKGGIGKRLAAWSSHNGIDVTRAPIFISERGAAIMEEDEARSIGQAVKMLSGQIGKPALVVIDTLHRNMGDGDENDAGDIARFLANIDRHIREPIGCAVLLVHHSGHGDKTRSRGSSAIRAALDAEFSLTLSQEGMRKLECTKQKDTEQPQAVALKARVVQLSGPWVDGDTGEQLTSLVLVPTEVTSESHSRGKLPGGGNQSIVWRELGPLFCKSSDIAQSGAPAGRPCLRFEDAISRVKAKLPCESDRQHERAKSAITGLISRGLLTFNEGWIWCC